MDEDRFVSYEWCGYPDCGYPNRVYGHKESGQSEWKKGRGKTDKVFFTTGGDLPGLGEYYLECHSLPWAAHDIVCKCW